MKIAPHASTVEPHSAESGTLLLVAHKGLWIYALALHGKAGAVLGKHLLYLEPSKLTDGHPIVQRGRDTAYSWAFAPERHEFELDLSPDSVCLLSNAPENFSVIVNERNDEGEDQLFVRQNGDQLVVGLKTGTLRLLGEARRSIVCRRWKIIEMVDVNTRRTILEHI